MTTRSIWTGPVTSLCSLSGLSLPSRPHSLILLEPFPNKTRNISLLPTQTVSAKQGPLPGQVAVSRHRTVTPDPGLVNLECFMEASRSAGALPLPPSQCWGDIICEQSLIQGESVLNPKAPGQMLHIYKKKKKMFSPMLICVNNIGKHLLQKFEHSKLEYICVCS